MIPSLITRSNWTSPTFGDGTQRILWFRVLTYPTSLVILPNYEWTFCTPTIINADTDSTIWSQGVCTLYSQIGPIIRFNEPTNETEHFQLYFEWGTSTTTYPVGIIRVEITLTDAAPLPPPTGDADEPDLIIGLLAPCGIFVAIGLVILFVAIRVARRVRGEEE